MDNRTPGEAALLALEYAANAIDGDVRRGVFIRAYVEDEEWAVQDLERWIERRERAADERRRRASASGA